MISETTLAYALLGGFVPAFFWLYFWLQKGKSKPRFRGRTVLLFLAGMLAVSIVYPLERLVVEHFGSGIQTTVVWAVIEETTKLLVCYIVIMWTRRHGGSFDPVESLIVTAIGFAAVENTLFISNPLVQGNVALSLTTGSLRFVGSSLVHVICSAVLGYVITLALRNRSRLPKFLPIFFGLAVATALHAVFNYFIFQNSADVFVIFGFVWAAAMVVKAERLLSSRKSGKVQPQQVAIGQARAS